MIHLKIKENLVKVRYLDFLLLVELIDGYCLNGCFLIVEKEKAEGHDIDQHVLLNGRKVFLLVIHQEADVDDVAEEILEVLDPAQGGLQLLPDAPLLGEEEGETLPPLQLLRLGDHLQVIQSSLVAPPSPPSPPSSTSRPPS